MGNLEYRSEKYSNIVDFKEEIKYKKEIDKIMNDPSMQKELPYFISSFNN